MHFHAYSLEEEDDQLRLQLAERMSTDAAGIAKCLGLQSEAKVELEAIVKLIESKLTDKTLMSIETPTPPASLIGEAAEDES